jgi:hypothetical protein
MPRGCGCAGNSCQCQIIHGPGLNVTGTGNASDPYVISLSDESGYRAYAPVGAGAFIYLSGTIVDDIVIFIDAEANFTVVLPNDAPLGVTITIITTISFAAVMTLSGGTIFWPGGSAPVLNGERDMVRLTQANDQQFWYGTAHLDLA